MKNSALVDGFLMLILSEISLAITTWSFMQLTQAESLSTHLSSDVSHIFVAYIVRYKQNKPSAHLVTLISYL